MGALTRRVFLRFSAALAVVALGLPPRTWAGGRRRDEIILVDGWVLRASDVSADQAPEVHRP